MKRILVAVAALGCGGWVPAQKPVAPLPPVPVGDVTGHVICADTQRVARFAEVQLMRKPDPSQLDKDGSVIDLYGSGKTQAAQILMLGGRTGLDGSFLISRVPVGDYWVIAMLPGYLPQWSVVADKDAAKDLRKVMVGVPEVRVTVEKAAEATLRLERGGSIGGRVQFEDGSAVVGMSVQAQPVDGVDEVGYARFAPLTNLMVNSTYRLKTDDDGRFRLPGLRPGKYLVIANVEFGTGAKAVAMGNGGVMYGGGGAAPMRFFYPGTLKKSAAKVVELKGSEQRTDLTIDVDPNTLHTVQGRVLDKEDGHAVNHGRATLTDTAEREFTRSITIQPDGSFRLEYVPAGSYELAIGGASMVDDPDPITFDTKVNTLKTYGKATVEVVVGDHDTKVEDVLVSEAKAKGTN